MNVAGFFQRPPRMLKYSGGKVGGQGDKKGVNKVFKEGGGVVL